MTPLLCADPAHPNAAGTVQIRAESDGIMADKRQIKVFIASPGDLAVERRTFKTLLDELNRGFGDGMGVEFIPLGWEDALAVANRRPQEQINQDVDACDMFLLVMHRRWGQAYVGTREFSS